MARTVDSARRVINGTWGEVWEDGIKVAEISAFQLKISKNKQKISMAGKILNDTKMTDADGTGSMTVYHVDSGHLAEGTEVKRGIDRRRTLVGKLADPDSWGAERVAVYGVSYDDITLMDWKAATPGSITRPFTFSDYELLDQIVPQ